MAGVLNKIIEGDKVIRDKLVSIDNKLGFVVQYQDQQDAIAKQEQKIKKDQLQALKRKKADKQTTFEKVFGVKEKKDAKGNGGILGMLTGPLSSALGAIGSVLILKALGIAAIGGALVAYIASEDFRKFINNNILAPIGNFIKDQLPILMNNLKNNVFESAGETIRRHTPFNVRSDTEETTEKIALTIEQVQKAKSKQERKVDNDTIRHTRGEITEEELNETKETQDALEKIAEVQSNLFNIQNDIEKQDQLIINFKKNHNPKQSGYQEHLDWLVEKFETLNETFEKQEKFLIDYIDKNEDAKSVLMSVGDDPIKRQKGGFIVPGNTTGDSFPAMLPEGSLVLNRNAVPHFQKGGMVPTLLEPREQVLYPGNFGMREVMLNKAFPRFQTGGIVYTEGHPDTGPGYTMEGKDAHNRPVVLSEPAAKAFLKTIMESDGAVKTSDVTSSTRTRAKNDSLPGSAKNSNHLKGNALDIHGTSKPWLKANGLSYGWKNLVYSGHDGHFDFVGGGAGLTPAAGDGKEASADPNNSTQGGAKTNIIDGIMNGFGVAGQAIGAVYEAFMEVFGEDLGALFDFSGGDDGGGGGNTSAVTGSANGSMLEGAKKLMEAGVPKIGAAYLAGNIQQESSWNGQRDWGQVMGDGTSRNGGLVSWASWADDPARLGKIEKHLGKDIKDADDGEQIGAMLWEMKNDYPDQYRVFMDPNASEAQLQDASYEYWRYGHEGPRFEFAEQVRQQLQTGGMVGNVSSMSGSYSSSLSAKSEEQFIEKLATSVTPVINLVPAYDTANTTVGSTENQTTPPTLSAYPNNNVALDLRNRVSINTAFS
jgi:hypothetical protein